MHCSEPLNHELDSFLAAPFVWRAQLGIDERSLPERGFEPGARPHPPERMKPTVETAGEGRINRRGKPCFYCANTRSTAMSEVRPWIGSKLSIAKFVVLRDLRILTAVPEPQPQALTIHQGEIANRIWDEVGRAFSEPVSRTTGAIDYAPTQAIAEFFEAQGLDGLMYRSFLAGERNIAIFDLDAVMLDSCAIREVRSLQYGFGPAENSYTAADR